MQPFHLPINATMSHLGFGSGSKHMAEKLKEFSRSIDKPLVITSGKEGSLTLLRGELFFEEAVAVSLKVDSVGCGDSYQAAFIVSWYKDRDVRKAMNAGAKAASEILQCYGGISDCTEKYSK